MWFSSLLKYVILIEDKGGSRYAKSLIVFKADDFQSAKDRALELGKVKETSYKNGDGEQVQWKLHSLETLDMLDKDINDGREVYCEFNEIHENEHMDFDTEFHPEESQPTETGV